MTKIVTDPSVPEALIVQIDAQGHALQVSIARERLHHAFCPDHTFLGLVKFVCAHLEHIRAAAWAQFVRTRSHTVSLTLEDLKLDNPALPAGR